MTKQIIAIDADDTIFDELTAIRVYMNDEHDMNLTADDYNVIGPFDNYFDDIWKMDSARASELYEEFALSDYKRDLKPKAQAADALRKLKQKYTLVIITSRGERVVDITHDSLIKYYPDVFADVHFTPLWSSDEKVTKAKICNDIGASFLIDDSFDHCRLAAESGVEAILFGDYGWNRSQELPPNIIRCTDWAAVEKYFITA